MNVNFLSFPPATSHHFMCLSRKKKKKKIILDGMSEHSIPLVLGKGKAGWEGGSEESAVSECCPGRAWEGTGGVFLLEKGREGKGDFSVSEGCLSGRVIHF